MHCAVEAKSSQVTSSQVAEADLVLVASLLDDPHFQAREAIVEIADRHGRPLPMQNVFPRLSATPGRVRHVGPALGEPSDAVLKDWLALDDAGIAALRDGGVI